jgi:hypothetical protein
MTEKTSFKVTYLGGPTAILEIGGLRIRQTQRLTRLVFITPEFLCMKN